MSWFHCVAGAMVKYGSKAMTGAVPFGEVLLDVTKDAWEKYRKQDTPTPDRHLTLASYIGGPVPEAFINTTSVGAPLPEMPLFLTPGVYVPVPLEATYQAAFDGVAAFWRDVLQRADA